MLHKNQYGKNQLVAIRKRTILHTLSIIHDSIDLSNTLGKPLAVVSLDFLKAFDKVDWDIIFSGISFSFLSLVTGINTLTWFALLPAQSNLKLKLVVSYFTLLSLTKDLLRAVHSQSCYVLLWLKYLQFSMMPIIKDIEIGDYESKIVNLADVTTIFLKYFSCHTKMELMLELCEKTSSLKINFSKSQTLLGVAYKNAIDVPRQMAWSQFSTKIVG